MFFCFFISRLWFLKFSLMLLWCWTQTHSANTSQSPCSHKLSCYKCKTHSFFIVDVHCKSKRKYLPCHAKVMIHVCACMSNSGFSQQQTLLSVMTNEIRSPWSCWKTVCKIFLRKILQYFSNCLQNHKQFLALWKVEYATPSWLTQMFRVRGEGEQGCSKLTLNDPHHQEQQRKGR